MIEESANTILNARASACKHWRWMAGMLTDSGHRLAYDDVAPLEECGGRSHADAYRPLIDFTDPVTLGCLLTLVRDVWDALSAPAACTLVQPDGSEKVVAWRPAASRHVRQWLHDGGFEAEVLVVALEAAHEAENMAVSDDRM